jgi:hypothetical protein
MQPQSIPLVALALLIPASSLRAAEFHPFDGPKPIAVFIQTDPWAMVIGADTPQAAFYEDGTVIFLKKTQDGHRYYQKKLSAAQRSDLVKRVTPVADMKGWKQFYSLRNATDQPEAMFYLRSGSRELTTCVYGLRKSGTERPDLTEFARDQKPDEVPKELLELHKFLCTLDYPDSKEWSPKYVEAMIWPYENSIDASIVWPKDWPGIGSQRSMKRGDSYSIFLDGGLQPELRKFLKACKGKGSVEIGGKKWAVSYRPVFPSEPVWMNALRSPNQK